MVFEKRMIILTGDGKGVLKTERNSVGLKGELTLFGVGDERKYLIVKWGSEIVEYALGVESKIALDFDARVDNDAHYIVSNHERALLYGTNAKNKIWWANLPVGVERKVEKKDFTPTPKTERAHPSGENLRDIFPSPCGYDDNAVAVDNYYDGKLELYEGEREVKKEEKEVERVQKVKEEKAKMNLRELGKISRACAYESALCEKMEVVSEGSSFLVPRTDDSQIFHADGRSMTYYERVCNQVEKLFSLGERDRELEETLPFTKWVKIDYDGKNKKFIVGLIGEKPDYICYGLPGKYSPIPPQELCGYCQWLPKEVTNPHGDGYWLIYQSAETGESITCSR